MKLGPHGNKPTRAGLDWARRASIVKAFDGTVGPACLEYLRVAPDWALRLFRHHFVNQDLQRPGADVAREILAALGEYRHPNLYVELYVGIPREQTADYADLIAAAVPVLHAAGLKVAGPSSYTGDFDPEHAAELRRRQWCGLDLWSMQAYWAGAGPTPWNALRHRMLWQAGDPDIVIVECGRDRIRDGDPAINDGYIGSGGWRADGVSTATYAVELLDYADELAKDQYVRGGVVFEAGPATADWAPYDTDPISDSLPAGTPPAVANADIAPGIPTIERLSPNYDRNRPTTRGIVLHATRGPGNRTLQAEFANTLAYFSRPGPAGNRRPSAHFVVGPRSVARIVHDVDVAWHAIENNQTHLGIEIAQPATEPDFVDFQYQATAEICRLWCAKYDIPMQRVFSQTVPGIVGHEDTEQGKRSGKSDPGHKFDWPRFLALLTPAVDLGRLEAELWGPLYRLKDLAWQLGRGVLGDAVFAALRSDKARAGVE